MKEPLARISHVLNKSDVVLEIIDARFPDRSKWLARAAKNKKKRVVFVLNKIDLIQDGEELAKRLGAVPFSATKRFGKRKLVEMLESMARGEKIVVGVVGRPNVGKSSIINLLAGRKAASTSSVPGHTKGQQWVRLSPRIMLIDSPGVLSSESTQSEMVLKNALSVDKLRDPIGAATQLLNEAPEVAEKLELTKSGEEALEEFALKTGKLKKGGEPNIVEAARMILRRWQKGL